MQQRAKSRNCYSLFTGRFSFMSELHFLIQDIAMQYVQIVEKAQINYLHSICLAEATVSTMHNANHALYSGMGPGPLRKNITHQFTKLTSILSLKVITFSAFLLEGSSQSNVFSMSLNQRSESTCFRQCVKIGTIQIYRIIKQINFMEKWDFHL